MKIPADQILKVTPLQLNVAYSESSTPATTPPLDLTQVLFLFPFPFLQNMKLSEKYQIYVDWCLLGLIGMLNSLDTRCQRKNISGIKKYLTAQVFLKTQLEAIYYAKSSTLHTCHSVTRWAKFQTSVAWRLASLFF